MVASGTVVSGEAESKGAEGSASPRNSLGFDEETSEMLSEARRRLLDLRQRLVKQQVHDAAAISSAVPLLEAAANDVPIGEASEGGCDEAELARRLEFWLQRSYGGCGVGCNSTGRLTAAWKNFGRRGRFGHFKCF